MPTTTNPSEQPPTERQPPRVWLVIGDKPGDNAQVQIIAEALGWPCERKQLYFQAPYVKGKPSFKVSLYHIDEKRSDPLEPPWPELIITSGRRPSMAALWIREQSGGRTQTVQVGRVKRLIEQFDLVVANPQFCVLDRPNVLHIELPLMRNNEAAIAAAATAWQARFAALPHPLTALLVGGQTQPFVLDARVAGQLLDRAGRMVTASGGTLYITTSSRTAPDVVEALQAGLPPGAILYRWKRDDPDNPYLALLGLADRFIVTGDSISMLVEVARLGKPLAIFPLPSDPGLIKRLRMGLTRLLQPDVDGRRRGLSHLLERLLSRLGTVSFPRDLTVVHRWLIEHGLAVRLGDPFLPPGPKAPDELPRVVERIKALLDHS